MTGKWTVAVVGLLSLGMRAAAQQTTPTPPPARRAGGFVPGQQRPPEDPAKVERGKTLYGLNCRGCHGADLRGGDMGGPNLLRSQVALSDQDGELIVPIIQGSRQNTGMPAISMSPDDAKAVAAYVRSVEATIGRQGTPPSVGMAVPSVLVGDAREGKAYFTAKCASCHEGQNSLQGIATRISDPKALQNYWVTGGGRGGRRAGGAAPGETSSARTVTANVTLASGEKFEGRLVKVDDFVVTLELKDGTARSFRRVGGAVSVDIHDPMKIHRDLLSVYTDKDMHDVTAYLETLK